MIRLKLILSCLSSLPALAVVAFFAMAPLPVHAADSTPVDPASEPAVKAVSKVLPAVVNVNTERIIRHSVRDPREEFFNQFFGGPMRPPRELKQKVQSLGSGFIVDPAGYIVTNQHVVERAEDLKIQVTTPDGKTYNARYVTGDASEDLALLKIESKQPLPFISLKDLSPNLLGQSLLVVGNPLGYGHSVARGILSATNRTLTLDDNEFKGLLQTDAAINPGNSGGPIIDLSGRLVGVASAKMAFTPQGVPTQGIGFAIPGNTVTAKVEEFKKEASRPARESMAATDLSSAARRLLGLTLQDLTDDLSDALGLEPGSGVLIADVEPDSPADSIGLRRGFVIYRVGRYAVDTPEDVDKLLQRAPTGTVIDLALGVTRRVGGRVVQSVQTVSLTAR